MFCGHGFDGFHFGVPDGFGGGEGVAGYVGVGGGGEVGGGGKGGEGEGEDYRGEGGVRERGGLRVDFMGWGSGRVGYLGRKREVCYFGRADY